MAPVSEQILRFLIHAQMQGQSALGCSNSRRFENTERPTCNYVTLTVVSWCKHSQFRSNSDTLLRSGRI